MRWHEWLANPAFNLRLQDDIVNELEAFRRSIGCSDDAFVLWITASPWVTRRGLLVAYEMRRGYAAAACARGLSQKVTEADFVKAVYEQRRALGLLV